MNNNVIQTQLLLFLDPRPLVDRLGREFFLQAPEGPGVYLMRDAHGTVLYVGKARNLRRRLASYRVANPDRLKRRHLRLLRAVARIEFELCPSEAAALDREAALLRTLRPQFNRVGTWPGIRRFLAWRVTGAGLELAVTQAVEPGWRFHGPLGAGALALRTVLVRLLWLAFHPERGASQMPTGWFEGRQEPTITLSPPTAAPALMAEAQCRLTRLLAGETEPFVAWVRQRTEARAHPFDRAALEADLVALGEFVAPPDSTAASLLASTPPVAPLTA